VVVRGYIAIPNETHIPLALEAIARKHILIEKPLGVSVADATHLCPNVGGPALTAVAFKKQLESSM